MSAAVAYLDASAAVKRLVREVESEALGALLDTTDALVSSEILAVELGCFVHRSAGGVLGARARLLLGSIELVAFTSAIRERAAAPFAPPQRALDAIHLASALHLQLDGLLFLSYDRQQLAAAETCGLTCLSPV